MLNPEFVNLNVSQIKSSGYVVDTLEASIWCILNTTSYEEAVLKAINLGEDTDTIGAITGSLAGIIYGSERIPQRWTSKLKNKEYLTNLIDNYTETLSNKIQNSKINNTK